MKKIDMFATKNDTDFYVVAIDGVVGLYETREEADEVYALVENIEETPFGSVQMMAPGYCPIDRYSGSDVSEMAVSVVEGVDLKQYIKKCYEERETRMKESAKNRLNDLCDLSELLA